MAAPKPRQTRKMSQTTKEEIFILFQECDKDRNGYVSVDEAEEVLSAKLGFDRKQTIKLVSMCDKNRDGKLSYDEFIDFFFRIRERVQEIEAIFHEFDSNHDGYVSVDEAKVAMRNLGVLNDTEIEALVFAYDVNKDGRLQYEEFVQFWNAQ